MSCSRMETKILAYVDGRLKESERLDVEKHLASCAACKLRATEFRAVHSLLDELPQIEPSEAFDLRVHALIAAEPVKQGWWSWLSVSPRAAFAAAMLVLATVWIGLRPGEPTHPVIADQDVPVVENADYDVISSFAPLSDLSQAADDDDDNDSGAGVNSTQPM
jgi:anti-sigma factor RsiW